VNLPFPLFFCGRKQRAGGRGQRAEGRGQRAEGRGQEEKEEGRRKKEKTGTAIGQRHGYCRDCNFLVLETKTIREQDDRTDTKLWTYPSSTHPPFLSFILYPFFSSLIPHPSSLILHSVVDYCWQRGQKCADRPAILTRTIFVSQTRHAKPSRS
jgi:hypothetical protein